MTARKYRLTDEVLHVEGRPHWRIQALRDVGSVRAGSLGGYVEREANLSHSGSSWVGDDAMVSGGAMIYGDAQVYGESWVCDRAVVCDRAAIESAWVSGSVIVDSDTWIIGGSVRDRDLDADTDTARFVAEICASLRAGGGSC